MVCVVSVGPVIGLVVPVWSVLNVESGRRSPSFIRRLMGAISRSVGRVMDSQRILDSVKSVRSGFLFQASIEGKREVMGSGVCVNPA